jgi:hypothetical protein
VRKKVLPYDAYHERYGDEMIADLDRIEREAGLLA